MIGVTNAVKAQAPIDKKAMIKPALTEGTESVYGTNHISFSETAAASKLLYPLDKVVA